MFNLKYDQNAEVVEIPFKSETINLKFAGFDIELDVEEYTTIDYSNIYGELLTISALINRVGIWRAEAEEAYDLQKLEVRRYEAERAELVRRELTTTSGNGNIKYPSNDMVDQRVSQDPVVINLHKKLYRLKKYHSVLDAFYWGVQNKSTKLSAISESMSLTPTEFEANIVESKVNGYFIQKRESIFSNKK